MVKVINGETGREYDQEGERKEFEMRLDFIKDDMGYETQEEFQKELVWIWKHHREQKTPIDFEHVQYSMLETVSRFEEAVEQRKVINE